MKLGHSKHRKKGGALAEGTPVEVPLDKPPRIPDHLRDKLPGHVSAARAEVGSEMHHPLLERCRARQVQQVTLAREQRPEHPSHGIAAPPQEHGQWPSGVGHGQKRHREEKHHCLELKLKSAPKSHHHVEESCRDDLANATLARTQELRGNDTQKTQKAVGARTAEGKPRGVNPVDDSPHQPRQGLASGAQRILGDVCQRQRHVTDRAPLTAALRFGIVNVGILCQLVGRPVKADVVFEERPQRIRLNPLQHRRHILGRVGLPPLLSRRVLRQEGVANRLQCRVPACDPSQLRGLPARRLGARPLRLRQPRVVAVSAASCSAAAPGTIEEVA
mmetsp:Transcript_155079/g.497205  ORF Transcript_155079/g.497205 Transcript_155079/m.497205 type:complete len:332 (-) Transcript_155079:120-1115(-)